MKLKNIILFVVMQAGFLSSCIIDRKQEGANLQVGDQIPEFAITLGDGTALTSAMLLGKVSVITFFNTTCPDCQKELPILQRFYDDYGKQVKLVCISREQGEDVVSAYWKEHGFTMPYSAQSDRTLYSKFAKSVIPRVYIIDKDLIIRAIFTDDPVATYDNLVEAISF